MRLTPLNKLPPRKEYLTKVLQALSCAESSEKELIEATGLTKTQVLCALEALIGQKVVIKDLKKKKFRMAT